MSILEYFNEIHRMFIELERHGYTLRMHGFYDTNLARYQESAAEGKMHIALDAVRKLAPYQESNPSLPVARDVEVVYNREWSY